MQRGCMVMLDCCPKDSKRCQFKSCGERLHEMTPKIPNLPVIASDIVIMHWHSISAPMGHKSVLQNQQHKHTDKLHLHGIKLRHLLTPKKCFCRSVKAMALIIQPRTECRCLVNEKYTDGDLCKFSVQMTELTNSSHGTERAETFLHKICRKTPF